MATSPRTIGLALAIGAIACAVGAAAWWVSPRQTEFYTDGATIHRAPEEAALRDILWQPPDALAPALNSAADELDPGVSAADGSLIFARRTPAGNTDLFAAHPRGEGWLEPAPITGLNTADNELGPTRSPDGRWLYFASDRPGGLGGFDLWRAPRTERGWGTAQRLDAPINSPTNDAWPAISADGRQLCFSSDRIVEPASGADLPIDGFNIYASAINGDEPQPPDLIPEVSAQANQVAPAFSPAGDFMYYASDGEASMGGFDLFRARLVDGQAGRVERLGDEVNSPDNELDPALSMGGFALHFSSDRPPTPAAEPGAYDLYRTTSREVYLGEETRAGDLRALLGLLPWILAALALVLLLSWLRLIITDEAWRVRLGTLGLMARCVLASLVLHAGLMALLSLWNVQPGDGLLAPDARRGVSLSSRAVASALESQLRGGFEAEPIEPADSPSAPPRASDATDLATAPPDQELPPAESDWRPTPLAASPGDSVAPDARPRAERITRTHVEPAAPSRPVAVVIPQNPTAARAAPEPTPEAARASGAPRWPADHVAEPGAISAAPLETEADVRTPMTLLEAPLSTRRDPDPDAPRSAPSPAANPVRAARAANPVTGSDPPPRRTPLDLAVPSVGPLARGPAPEAEEAPTAWVAPRTERQRPRTAAPPLVGAPAEARSPSPMVSPDAPTVIDRPDDAPMAESRAAAPSPVEVPARQATLALAIPKAAPKAARFRVSGLVIDAETREPIRGAVVRLDREGAEPLTEATDSDGAFVLTPRRVPEHSAVTASKHGYVPGAVNVSERDFERGVRITIELSAHNPWVIALEENPEVHHLGNDEFSGRVNSQFQRRSEGTSLTRRFRFDAADMGPRIAGATIHLLAKGVQIENPIYLNGRLIGRLPRSPADGSFAKVRMPLPIQHLRDGVNTIELQSVRSANTDVDDYEFVNITVVFKPRGESL